MDVGHTMSNTLITYKVIRCYKYVHITLFRWNRGMPGIFYQLFNPKPGVFQSDAEVKKAPKSTPTTPRDGRPSPE